MQKVHLVMRWWYWEGLTAATAGMEARFGECGLTALFNVGLAGVNRGGSKAWPARQRSRGK